MGLGVGRHAIALASLGTLHLSNAFHAVAIPAGIYAEIQTPFVPVNDALNVAFKFTVG